VKKAVKPCPCSDPRAQSERQNHFVFWKGVSWKGGFLWGGRVQISFGEVLRVKKKGKVDLKERRETLFGYGGEGLVEKSQRGEKRGAEAIQSA